MSQSELQLKRRKSKGSWVKRSRRAIFNRLAKGRLKQSGELWAHLVDSEEVTASTGCDLREYWWLYNYVTTQGPEFILECGAGISTIVMGFAIKELERQGRPVPILVSMEDVGFYYENLVQLIPPGVEPYVNIHLSRVEDVDFDCGTGRAYTNVPDYPYDFVFTDGPSLPVDVDRPYFDCDYIHVVRRSKRKVVGAVDGRKSTRAAYRKLLPNARQMKLRSVGFYYIEASAADFVPPSLESEESSQTE